MRDVRADANDEFIGNGTLCIIAGGIGEEKKRDGRRAIVYRAEFPGGRGGGRDEDTP